MLMYWIHCALTFGVLGKYTLEPHPMVCISCSPQVLSFCKISRITKSMSEFLRASDWYIDPFLNASTFFAGKEAIDREENGAGENRASSQKCGNQTPSMKLNERASRKQRRILHSHMRLRLRKTIFVCESYNSRITTDCTLDKRQDIW